MTNRNHLLSIHETIWETAEDMCGLNHGAMPNNDSDIDRLNTILSYMNVRLFCDECSLPDYRPLINLYECGTCHKMMDCRPYGPNGSNICVDCALNDPETENRMFAIWNKGKEGNLK